MDWPFKLGDTVRLKDSSPLKLRANLNKKSKNYYAFRKSYRVRGMYISGGNFHVEPGTIIVALKMFPSEWSKIAAHHLELAM